MGQDAPHRRRASQGDSAYVLSVDVAGPFHKGWDFRDAKEAKYALIATVPIPIGTMDPPGPRVLIRINILILRVAKSN